MPMPIPVVGPSYTDNITAEPEPMHPDPTYEDKVLKPITPVYLNGILYERFYCM